MLPAVSHPRFVVCEDGSEYIDRFRRFLGDAFEFVAANDLAAAEAAANGTPPARGLLFDLDFRRTPPERLVDERGATGVAPDEGTRRRLVESQGIFILRALRARGVGLPAMLFADLDDAAQAAFLERNGVGFGLRRASGGAAAGFVERPPRERLGVREANAAPERRRERRRIDVAERLQPAVVELALPRRRQDHRLAARRREEQRGARFFDGRRAGRREDARPRLAVVAEARRALLEIAVDALEAHAVARGDLEVAGQRGVAQGRLAPRRAPREPIRHRADRREDLGRVGARGRGAQEERRIPDAERLRAARVAQEAHDRAELGCARLVEPVDAHHRGPHVAGPFVAVVVDLEEARRLAAHLEPVPAPQRRLRGRVVARGVAQHRGILGDDRHQQHERVHVTRPPKRSRRRRWPRARPSGRPSPCAGSACRAARPRRSRPTTAARR